MSGESLEERLKTETEARLRAEELLREERGRYENAPGLFCSIDADTLLVIRCNQSFAIAIGRTNSEIIGHSVLELSIEPERDRLRTLLASTQAGGATVRNEIQLRSATGTFLASVNARQSETAGNKKDIQIIFQDVTGPRNSHVSLGDNQERLESLFKASPDFLLLVDRQHRIELINRVEASWRLEDVLGAPLSIFFAPEDHDSTRLNLERVFHDREPQQWDVKHLRADGTTRHFDAIASPVIVADEVTQCVIALRDTSSQIQLQNEKRKLEEQIRQTQKMEAVGRLAGGIAHDFNNILTAIMGYTSLAQYQLAKDDPRRKWADEVGNAATRAADLTKQLLAFSRRQVIAPKVINLSELTLNLVPMLGRLIGETVNLRTVTSEDLEGVLIDPGQAEQILLNLVINARDAIEEDGEVLVETACVSLDEDYAKRFPRAKPGKHIMLTVSDTGCGMAPEIRNQIFEPFFTTKGQGRGTGLGLATVFGIVEQAGGWIEIYSEVGLGSSFKIYFPCASGEIEALASTSPTEAPIGGHETVLLVEDEDMVRDLAVSWLSKLGYCVLPAASGDEALELSGSHEGEIDILVTDVVMPGMNGRQLADRLLETRPQTLVLFTSGYPQDIITHKGVLEEGVEFLPKPYSLESLAILVRQIIDKE